jgi:acyl carrier protein
MSNSEQLRNLICEILGFQFEEPSFEFGMGNPPEWDSFAQISIMLAAEEKWSVQFSPIEIGENTKFKVILELIESKL